MQKWINIDKILVNAQKKQQELLIALTAIILITVGYSMWEYRVKANIKQASIAYYHTIRQKEKIHTKESIDKLKSITQDYPSTIYSQLAHARLAKIDFENKKYRSAAKHYEIAISYMQENNLKSLFKLRLAKIYLHAHEPKKTLDTLRSVNTDSFKYIKAITEIDAHIQLKDYSKAQESISTHLNHEEAKEGHTKNGESMIFRELLQQRQQKIKA
ncbi:MAG: tetratricopeptide repeat protein [Pseudomonadota bacterium]|nr:tetratricopeptide repeat protein [Pseudomonadota bacterium]